MNPFAYFLQEWKEDHPSPPHEAESLRVQLAKCESPIEGLLLAALWVDKPNLMVIQPQAVIPTEEAPIRVDFLISWHHPAVPGRLRPLFCVECDSAEYHLQVSAFHKDRTRDRNTLTWNGLPTLRFTGKQITDDPRSCSGDILGAFFQITGLLVDHLFPPGIL